MKPIELTKRVIQKKKETYYPLFTNSISLLLYWIITSLLGFRKNQVSVLFLSFSISIFIFLYSLDSLDVYYEQEEKIGIISKILLFIVFFIVIINAMIIILRLEFLIISDFFYIIPISIHSLVFFSIFYFLRKELNRYYFLKNININKKEKTETQTS